MKANDFVILALKSPLHLIMGETMLVTVTGRKTGRKITLPVNYYQEADNLWVLTSRDRTWWRNLRNGGEVDVRLHGRDYTGAGELVLNESAVASRLTQYVRHQPDSARYFGLRVENGGLLCWGSTEYGAIITNHAGGYSFYRSGATGRFLRMRFNGVPLDQPGRYFYLRDRKSGDFWSASWQPVGKPLDRYQSVCRHGMGYTILESRYEGIATEATYFVPLGQTFEYWRLKVKNESKEARQLSVFTYCEFANLWETWQDLVNLQYSQFITAATLEDGILGITCNPNFDFDGDWRGDNNWDALNEGASQAYVYYTVMETQTHWFLIYNLFHPRDYSDKCVAGSCHEDDNEGLILTVRQDGSAEVRVAVRQALLTLPSGVVPLSRVDVLLEILTDREASESARADAARRLSETPDPRSIPVLIAALKAPLRGK